MTTHAKLSPSGASRWMVCAGAPRLCEGIPDTSSPYAAEGTAAHAVAESCLRSGQSAVGTSVQGFVVTAEMADAVDLYVSTVLADYEVTCDKAELHIESRFDLGWLGRPDLSGTADAVIRDPFGTLRVYDFKYGMTPVEALDNPQMMYYGTGAAQDGTYEDVELIVVQPRARHEDGPVRRCRMPLEDLLTWARDVLIPAAVATEAPDAPLVAGSHCRFCKALAICPAQREQASLVARTAFEAQPVALPSPDALAPADLRVVLERAEMVEAWFNACRAHVHHLLETGAVAPETVGHKLVRGRATRKWADEGFAETGLVLQLGDAAYTKKIISPAQAEKAKVLNMPEVTETRGVQLAPLSDKRDAVNPLALAFTEVEA
jgi:hypothetical protein